jgi:hypothetical protein
MRRTDCGHSTTPQVRVRHSSDLIEAFAASLMRLVLEHRGDSGANLVRDFERRVIEELCKYERKPDISLDEIRHLHCMCDNAVARAIKAGRVTAFEPAEV